MVHRYRNNGYNIVLDVNSGAVHVVDDVVYDLIPFMEEEPQIPDDELVQKLGPEYDGEEIREAAKEIRTLYQAGTLFSKDVFEPYMERFTEEKKGNPVIKALCLHIAHDCNLRCAYCFAGDGEYHGRKALMSYEVGKKALDLLKIFGLEEEKDNLASNLPYGAQRRLEIARALASSSDSPSFTG